jgi:WD40 repeat protein
VWDAESGVLHRELEGFGTGHVNDLASFLSPEGQQPRLVAGSSRGHVRVYDPEAGSTLHFIRGHLSAIHALACISSSSAAPHHPRLVSASDDHSAKVWDGETGEMLADLRGHQGAVRSVAVWTEPTGGHDHDRIATGCLDGHARVWDGEALTLLHDLDCGDVYAVGRLAVFEAAEGPARLLVAPARDGCVQAWDPEEGRLLHDDILLQRGLPLTECHLLESAQGR